MGEPGQTAFRTQLAWALAVALLLRLLLAFVPVDPYINPDSHAFSALAASLHDNHRLAYVDEGAPGLVLRAFRSLLYPAFLAPLVRSSGDLDLGLLLPLQGLLGIVVVLMVAWLARRAFGVRVAVVTAWIGALYASTVLYERQVTSEALFTPLLLGATCCAAAAWPRGTAAGSRASATHLVASTCAGILLGLAALTRPAGLAAAAAVAAIGLLVRPRLSASSLITFTGAFALTLLPALLRNRAVVGAPVLLTSGGMNLWIGNGRGTVGEAWRVMERLLPSRGEVATDQWFYHDAWTHAGDLVRRAPGVLWTKLRTFTTPLAHDGWSLGYRLTYPIALAGIVGPWARGGLRVHGEATGGAAGGLADPMPADPSAHAIAWLLVAVALSQFAVAMASVPWSRYRSPMEPFLWPFAAAGAIGLWRAGRAGRVLASTLVLASGASWAMARLP